MKIQIYILAYRDRHGDSGIEVLYSKRAMFDVLVGWLLEFEDEEDIKGVNDLLDAEKYEEAESRIEELADASGHEWVTSTEVVDVEKAEIIEVAGRVLDTPNKPKNDDTGKTPLDPSEKQGD